MKRLKKIIVALIVFAACISGNSYAGKECPGKITTLAIGPTSGTLQVGVGGYGVHYLCRLYEVYNNVQPETCRGLYSMFLAAKSSGRNVSQYYNGITSCTQAGNWQVPSPFPYFIKIN